MTEAAKFTPGPWHLSDETERDGLRSRLLHGMPEGMLAIIRVEHQGAYYGDANARLIAAAPDMLDALAWYADATDAEFKNDGGKRARAAIAKATN